MKVKDVAYGSLDLRQKQDLRLAEHQIKELAKKKPKEWFFDIIHTPNQTPRALAYKPEVEALLKRYCPDVPEFAVTVHLNVNDRQLRARNKLFKKIYENDITDVKHKGVAL